MSQEKKTYSVAVVATMSAGKSTLLNALIGRELLPSQNEACTATVFRIKDEDELKNFQGRYYSNDQGWSEWIENITVDTLANWNTQAPVQVELRGNLPKIAACDNNKIVFIDTPGPNNASNINHAKIAEAILATTSYSSIIFVINASVAGVKDEWSLLCQLQKIFARMKQPPQIIFAINKIDVLDIEKSENIAQFIKDNTSYLQELGFINPIVVPTCSEMALLIRQALGTKTQLPFRNIPAGFSKRQGGKTIQYFQTSLQPRQQQRLKSLLTRFSKYITEYGHAFSVNKLVKWHSKSCRENYHSIVTRRSQKNTTVRKLIIDDVCFNLNFLEKMDIYSGIPVIESFFKKSLRNFTENQTGILGNNDILNEERVVKLLCAISQEEKFRKEELQISKHKKETAIFENNRPIAVDFAYNPYFVRTTIKVNGALPDAGSPLLLLETERLHIWIDGFMPLLYNLYKSGTYNLHFKGTKIDADTISIAIEKYKQQNPGFTITFDAETSSKNDDERIKELKCLYETGKQGPFAELFTSDAMEAAFQRAIDPYFEVNVIATMSSGKSTLINSMLGVDLLPSKNEACTATIAKIWDDDDMDCFMGQNFDEKGKELCQPTRISKEILEQWNDDEKTNVIEIAGNVPCITQTESCSMVIIDTPGPNNSRNQEHQKTTLTAIRSKPLSMILYVLNSTQLSTTDDDWLLSQVCDAMSAGGRQAQDRFIFIANKIDAFDPEKKESVSTALENVKKYLNEHGIKNPQIIPVSAQLAKLVRLKRDGAVLTRSEKNDLDNFVDLFTSEPEMNMFEHCRPLLSAECISRIEKQIENAMKSSNKEDLAEILSGIPIIEALLDEFLRKYAIPSKLKDAVDSFNDVITKSRIAEGITEQLKRSDKELEELTQKLTTYQNDSDRLNEAKEYRTKVASLSYSISENGQAACDELYEKSEQLIAKLQNDLSDAKSLPTVAQKRFDEAVKSCQQFETELVVRLSDELKKEYGTVIERLRNGYQARVAKILNENFPDNMVLQDLHAASMTLPTVYEMVNYYSHTEKVKTGTRRVWVGNERVAAGTERVKVGTEKIKVGTERYCCGSHEESDSHWYNPFSWGRTKTVRDYAYRDVYETRDKYETRTKYELRDKYEERDVLEDKTYVDMRPAAKDLVERLRKFSIDNRSNFEKEAAKNVEQAKAVLLGLMDVIDQRVSDLQNDLTAAAMDKQIREKVIKENQEKAAWFNVFKQKLSTILEV